MDSNQDQGVVEPIVNEVQPVESVLPEPTPSSNQTPIEETSQAPVQGETQPENPRTVERLEQLLEENKRLKAQQNQKTYGTSVFDSFNPQVSPGQPQVPQSQVEINQFVQADGTVDINGFNQAIARTQQEAQAAKREAQLTREQVARLEESQQVREAHQVHSWLDPQSPNFDPKGYELVRDKMLSSMVFNTKMSLLEAANAVSEVYRPLAPVDVAKVKEQAVKEGFKQAKQAQELRNQGPIEAGAGEPRQTPDKDLQELKQQTRKGGSIGEEAAMERLKALGIVKG